jgi:hypothetical protein
MPIHHLGTTPISTPDPSTPPTPPTSDTGTPPAAPVRGGPSVGRTGVVAALTSASGGAAQPPLLPTADSAVPWGGPDPSKWRPEAIMANAVSAALNDAWSQPDTADAVVAIPTHMQPSNLNEFGDGQTDAAPSFQSWNQSRPPVVATLVTKTDGSQQEVFRFDRALPISGSQLEAITQDGRGGWSSPQPIQASRDANGDLVATIDVPKGSALADPNKMTLVHPQGWNDWFPIRFQTQTTTAQALLNSVPANMRTFSDGRPILDPMGVSVEGSGGAPGDVFNKLESTSFGGDYNQTPWNPTDIHGRVPDNVVTSVGQGWTWVGDQSKTPFKLMYTAFDKRDPQAEAQFGVPSGGGWHEIGDPAETIINDLEPTPIPVGYTQGNPLPGGPPSGQFSYGLGDCATVRFLKPGEAFTVPQGTADQPNYHWYFMSGDKPVVTEEWVHPWRPPGGAPTFGPKP